ncbi:MAG: hypothetical protein NDI94_01060 [Candidatus Woesearchaeota archaeon]|nr:hypothetical protein [Candidatus Woesearchaeota archaeon]
MAFDKVSVDNDYVTDMYMDPSSFCYVLPSSKVLETGPGADPHVKLKSMILSLGQVNLGTAPMNPNSMFFREYLNSQGVLTIVDQSRADAIKGSYGGGLTDITGIEVFMQNLDRYDKRECNLYIQELNLLQAGTQMKEQHGSPMIPSSYDVIIDHWTWYWLNDGFPTEANLSHLFSFYKSALAEEGRVFLFYPKDISAMEEYSDFIGQIDSNFSKVVEVAGFKNYYRVNNGFANMVYQDNPRRRPRDKVFRPYYRMEKLLVLSD